MQNCYRQISIIFFIFLLLVLIVFGYTPTNDGEGYLEYAHTCLNYGELYPCTPTIQGEPFIWNIGQINLVILSLYLFNTIVPILVLMCLLKACSAYLLARITQKLLNERIALIAILLYVCYPNNWGQSTTILSEIPSVTLLLWGIFLILHSSHYKQLFIAGFIMAFSNWFRPLGLIFIGTFILYFLIFERQKWWRKAGSLLAGYLLFITVVGTSCWLRTGYFLYQSDTLWFNMVAATYETSVEPHYNAEMYPKGTLRYIEDREHKTAIECKDIWKQRSINWLKHHPFTYLKNVPRRLLYMYTNDMDNISAFLSDKSSAENNYITLPYRSLLKNLKNLTPIQWLGLYNMIFYWLLLLSTIFSFHFLLKEKQYKVLFLTLSILVGGSLALVLAVHGETRFKAPFMPFIIMTAAISIAQCYGKKSYQKKG